MPSPPRPEDFPKPPPPLLPLDSLKAALEDLRAAADLLDAAAAALHRMLQTSWHELLSTERATPQEDPLMEALADLPDDFLVLRWLRIEEEVVIETAIVGPNGIWIFVHLPYYGMLERQGDQWRYRDPRSGDERILQNPPDRQWERQKEKVLEILHAHPTLAGIDWENAIRGGLVLRPDARLRGRRPPIPCLNPAGWRQAISETEALPFLEPIRRLQVCESLLQAARSPELSDQALSSVLKAVETHTQRIEKDVDAAASMAEERISAFDRALHELLRLSGEIGNQEEIP